MILESIGELLGEGLGKALLVGLAVLVEIHRVIQHGAAKMVDCPRPDEMASLLPVKSFTEMWDCRSSSPIACMLSKLRRTLLLFANSLRWSQHGMSSLLSWNILLTIRPSKDDIRISMVKLSGGILEAEPAGSRNVDKVETPVEGMSWGKDPSP